MSHREASRSNLHRAPVAEFQYRQMIPVPVPTMEEAQAARELVEAVVEMTESSFLQRLAQERAAGFAEAEAGLRQELQQRSERERNKISSALLHFEQMRKEYFARVETEVVQLALTIAGKILHRESQVDHLLVAALVQIALGQLREGAAATIRLRPEEAEPWRAHFAAAALGVAVKVIEDGELGCGDCVLETEMGTVNFSLDAQLKEVERGFLDVLAHRPQA